MTNWMLSFWLLSFLLSFSMPLCEHYLAQQELDRLQEHIFEPTADEVAAFNSAIADAQAALRDFVSVKEKLRTLFGEANQQLKTLRAGTLGDGSRDDELARRRLDGEQKAFDRLGKTGRPGGKS
jgi:hypothetical protein